MHTKMTENFSEEFLDSLRPENKAYEVRDSKERYLYCRVSPKGVKTFLVVKCVKRVPTFITIGRRPDVKLKDARKRAVEICNDLNNDKNVNKQKKEAQAQPSLISFFYDKYLPQHAEKYTSPKKVKENTSIFERRFKKKWANLKLTEITRDEVEKMHTAINAQDGLYAANKALTLIKHILNKAVEWRMLEYSPAYGIKPYKEQARERFISPEELINFFDVLEKEENQRVKCYIYLSLYTGQRRSNVISMNWKDIDFINKVWHIPITKNGESMNVPLIPEALELLSQLKKDADSEWVFPTRTGANGSKSGHWNDPKRQWKKFLEKSCIQNLRIHDIRRTLGSYEAIAGVNLPAISKTLGHKSYRATEIYARLNTAAVREAISTAIRLMHQRAEEAKEAQNAPL